MRNPCYWYAMGWPASRQILRPWVPSYMGMDKRDYQKREISLLNLVFTQINIMDSCTRCPTRTYLKMDRTTKLCAFDSICEMNILCFLVLSWSSFSCLPVCHHLLSKLHFPFHLLFHKRIFFYTLKSASTQKNWSTIERDGFPIADAGFRRTSRNYGFHRNRAI